MTSRVHILFLLQKRARKVRRQRTHASFSFCFSKMFLFPYIQAKNLISAKQMATYAGILRDVLWPNGSQVQTNGGMSKSATPENSSVRDEAMKLRTRVLCRAVMFGSVAGAFLKCYFSIFL